MRNHRYDVYLPILKFNARFGGNIGLYTILGPNSLGSQLPAKQLADWLDLLGHLLSRNHVSEIFEDQPPLRKNDA